jgi:hypothetical protein
LLRVVNVTSSFETNSAGVNLTATLLGTVANDTTPEADDRSLVTVRAEFEGLQVDNITVPASGLTGAVLPPFALLLKG